VPSISISNNKLHIVWEDDTLGNHEINQWRGTIWPALHHEIRLILMENTGESTQAVQSTKGIILIRINESSSEDCNWDILPCRSV
jgi:hypothetical protein